MLKRLQELENNLEYFDAGINAYEILELIVTARVFIAANSRMDQKFLMEGAAVRVHMSEYSSKAKQTVLDALKGN